MAAGRPGIFISYRRDDASAWAGRLYDHRVADELEVRQAWKFVVGS